ncbi:MAG: UDP-N-acetylmuramoyl-tripeptide--D-alanyl-D-alanine ligase [Chlamydiales bacterium]|nr:UDP-N-acetylmuramoyl-tripeptide--D-alanyl-D-alanine ligase [Chlamydiales bacterium]
MLPLSVKSIGELLNYKIDDSKIVLGVSVNSKLVKKQDLFFALPGSKQDGHSFLQEVSQRGAVAAIVSSNYSGDDFGLSLIKVFDVLKALQRLAEWYLHFHRPKVVGITGSLGKTTTKDFTTTLLRSRYKVGCTPGNANSRIGVPLSILGMQEPCDILVVEMGQSEPGDLKSLVQVVPPDIAVITTVAYVHACNFESLQQIAISKAEILSHPATKVGIVNKSMPFVQDVCKSGACIKRTFSCNDKNADHYIKKEEDRAHIYYKQKKCISIPWSIMGDHNLQNYLAAVVVARECLVSYEEIKMASENLRLPHNRLERIEKKGITFINDAYNASEQSVCAALSSLPKPHPGKKKIAVLGDMKELGKFSESAHRVVGKYALQYVDQLFCLGDGCQVMQEYWDLAKKTIVFAENKEDLIMRLKASIEPGDVVLIKGSRSHGLDSLIEEMD